jgi:amino acid transporter
MTGYPGGYPPPQPPYGGYQPPYGGYQPPYGGYQPPPNGPRNGLGIAALVIAVIGLVFCWTVIGGIVLGVVAVILGIVGRGRAKRGEATNGGVAIGGTLLGVLAIIASLVFIPIWMGVFSEVGGSDYLDCVSRAGSDPTAVEGCADRLREHLETQFSVTPTPRP